MLHETLTQIHPRRRALKIVGLTAAGSLLALAGCSKTEATPPTPTEPVTPPPATPPPAATDPAPPVANAGGAPAGDASCASAVDEASKSMRRALQYKEKTDNEKNCLGCVQFVAGSYGECGGCKLFTGPVQPQGICLSYAPKAV